MTMLVTAILATMQSGGKTTTSEVIKRIVRISK